MSIIIKDINPSNSLSEAFDKINQNFDQIVLAGGGPPGIQGPTGIQGIQGSHGVRGSKWQTGTTTNGVTTNIDGSPLLTGDQILLDNGEVYTYDNVWGLTSIDLTGPTGPDGRNSSINWEIHEQTSEPNLSPKATPSANDNSTINYFIPANAHKNNIFIGDPTWSSSYLGMTGLEEDISQVPKFSIIQKAITKVGTNGLMIGSVGATSIDDRNITNMGSTAQAVDISEFIFMGLYDHERISTPSNKFTNKFKIKSYTKDIRIEAGNDNTLNDPLLNVQKMPKSIELFSDSFSWYNNSVDFSGVGSANSYLQINNSLLKIRTSNGIIGSTDATFVNWGATGVTFGDSSKFSIIQGVTGSIGLGSTAYVNWGATGVTFGDSSKFTIIKGTTGSISDATYDILKWNNSYFEFGNVNRQSYIYGGSGYITGTASNNIVKWDSSSNITVGGNSTPTLTMTGASGSIGTASNNIVKWNSSSNITVGGNSTPTLTMTGDNVYIGTDSATYIACTSTDLTIGAWDIPINIHGVSGSIGNIDTSMSWYDSGSAILQVSDILYLAATQSKMGIDPEGNGVKYIVWHTTGVTFGDSTNKTIIQGASGSIGTASNGLKWDTSGNFSESGGNITITATNFILNSDKRLKTNIEDLNTSDTEIKYKQFELISTPGELRYGVIAQELKETHPELVNENNEGMMSVKYIDLLVYEIAKLKEEMKELKSIINHGN